MGQGFIPNDWEGEYCCYTVQWPNSPQWLAVLRGVLTLPATGRFWDEHTGTITEAQDVIKETFDTNLHLEEVLMSCNDTTSIALTAIANSIALLANKGSNASCCTNPQVQVNNSIQGFVPNPASGIDVPIYGSTPPTSLEPDTFPDGYDNLEQYQEDKCRKANALVNATIAANKALGAITSFNFAGLTAITVMCIGGVLVVAPELIPILVAGIILLGLNVSYLDAAGDYMEDHKQEWVCALYNGDSTDDMITAIADLLDVLISAISATGVIGFTIKTAVLVLLNTDNLNKLLNSEPIIGSGDVSCDACDCDILTFEFEGETHGYTFVADSCFGTTPSTAGASIDFSGEGLQMFAPNVGSTNACNAAGPDDLSIVIQLGWEIVIAGFRIADFNNFVRVDAMLDGSCASLTSGGFTALTTTEIIASLDAFEGQTLENINIYVNNSISQEVGIEITLIQIRCAT